jgi:hypothetical protein
MPPDPTTAGLLDRIGSPEGRRDYALAELKSAYQRAWEAEKATLDARLDRLPDDYLADRRSRAKLVAEHGRRVEALRQEYADAEASIRQTYDLEAGLRDGLAALVPVPDPGPPVVDLGRPVVDFGDEDWWTE